jgi:mono/diheme cytochrome c family protein
MQHDRRKVFLLSLSARMVTAVCSAALMLSVSPPLRAQDMSKDALVARGQYLATVGICEACHSKKDANDRVIPETRLAGGGRIGGLETPNLTPDNDTGIGTWTEQQIVDALRNGKRPDGSTIRPPMGIVWYRSLSDRDAHAIAAYLLSLKPVVNKVARTVVDRPEPKYGEAVTHVAETPRTDKLAYGAYMAKTISHCMQCHTPRVKGEIDMTRLGAGGNSYAVVGGGTVVSTNITPANKTSIASWSDDAVKAAITKGVRPDGGKLVPVMDFNLYAQLTSEDLDMLVGFLRTLPATEFTP